MKGSTDSTKDLAPHVRLLLRADTIFKEDASRSIRNDEDLFRIGERSPAIPLLCYYPDIVSQFDGAYEFSRSLNSQVMDADLEKYHRYSEAEALVKAMLVDIQMSDVARMEFDAMKARFACGRCTERTPMTWDNLVRPLIIPFLNCS